MITEGKDEKDLQLLIWNRKETVNPFTTTMSLHFDREPAQLKQYQVRDSIRY